MSMPPVDEEPVSSPEDHSDNTPQWLEPPDRPISAPPVLDPDGANLFAFRAATPQAELKDIFASWDEPPDRPNSAPLFDKEPDAGDDEARTEEPALGARLGAIGSSLVPPHRAAIGPRGEGLFAFQVPHMRMSSPPMSPPPAIREHSADSGHHSSPSITLPQSGRNSTEPWAKSGRNSTLEADMDRRCTPPPSMYSGLGNVPNHLQLSQSPGLSTPPPTGFGSSNPHTPGLGIPQNIGGGDYGPALLHPGAVRAFEPIDRPISAPPALDTGAASLLAFQASQYAAGLQAADIRCDESYHEFFQLYGPQNVNLPPPLDPSPELMRARARPGPHVQPSSESAVDPGTETQPSAFGVASFGPATGFQDSNPNVIVGGPAGHGPAGHGPAGHGPAGHMPRSPSPPWDSTNVAATGSAAAAHHVNAQQVAQAQAQGLHAAAQYAQLRQQQIPGHPTGVGSDAGVRHSTLLGAAGYPPAYGEGPPAAMQFPWLGMPGAPPAGMSMANPSQFSQAKAGAFGPPNLGVLQPPQLAGLTQPGASQPQFEDGRGPSDLTKRTRDLVVDAAGRGQRPASTVAPGMPGNPVTNAASVLTGSPPNTTAGMGSLVGPLAQDWNQQGEKSDKKSSSRTGFKISHLEDIFSSNAFLQNVYPIAKDQAGCRMLQHKLDEGNPEVTNAIFMEVLAHCVELMMDPFGNYLCQKLMDMCNHRQLELILDKVCGDLVRISLNMHGARAVQKLIDVVRPTQFITRLTASLEGAVVALTKDPNGNHVIQRCLEVVPVESRSFIFRAVAADIIDVASHRHGCRIVQRCIDSSQGQDKHMLVASICSQALHLVQDAFGNYVVQYILGMREPAATAHIIHSMRGRLHVLSRQKFSSNVVERCIQLSGPDERNHMLMELTDPRGIGELLRDVYGNYVVQSALTLANEQQLQIMLDYIRPVLPSLRSSGQGRRIAQKLEKKYPQLRVGSGDANAAARRGGQPGNSGNSAAEPHAPPFPSPPMQPDGSVNSSMGGAGAIFPQGMQHAPAGIQNPGLIGMTPMRSPLPPGAVASNPGVPVNNDLFSALASGGAGAPPQVVGGGAQPLGGRGTGKQKRGRRKEH